MLSQTCINFFLVLNTKDDISKNVGNQNNFDRRENIEDTEDQKRFGFPRSSE